MERLILVRPTKLMHVDVMEYRQEYINYGETSINGSAGLMYFNYFNDWINNVHLLEKGKCTRENISATTFLTVREVDQRVIGMIQLRHTLNKELEVYGGQIGYGIRPTERKKGYATQQLGLVLEIAKQMKLYKVMIQCDKKNLASAKVIRNNGGILEWEELFAPTGEVLQVYWIQLDS